MGILSIFKKKEDFSDPNFMGSLENMGSVPNSNDPSLNIQSAFDPQQNFSQNSQLQPSISTASMQQSFQPQIQTSGIEQQTNSGLQKDLEIISVKLDSLKSQLDMINQRVSNIEKIAEREQQIQLQQQKKWY